MCVMKSTDSLIRSARSLNPSTVAVARSMRVTISATWLAAPSICSPALRARSPISCEARAANRALSEISSIDTARSRVIDEVLLTMSAVPSAPLAIVCIVEEISSVVAFISCAVADSPWADSKIWALTPRTSVTMLNRLCSMVLNERATSPTSSVERTSTLRVRSPWLITALTAASSRRCRVKYLDSTTAAPRPMRISPDT